MECALASLVFVHAAEAEIGDFQVALCVEKHVLRLDVTVCDALAVDVHESGNELHKVKVRKVLLDANVWCDFVKEVAAGAELEENIQARHMRALQATSVLH